MLEVRNLSVSFESSEAPAQAVKEVSFHLGAGEKLAVIGESGSGKSTLGHAILNLIDRSEGAQIFGSVSFLGQNLLEMSDAELRSIRGDRISMIFQDPTASLNPNLKIGHQITETLRSHRAMTRSQARRRSDDLIRMVGLGDVDDIFDRYPHELSVGMRQRATIAVAISCEPDILVADEPTSALDVTVRAGIINLIESLHAAIGCAIILISHDLDVVASLADRAIVMCGGLVVEAGSTQAMYEGSLHPYTLDLMEAKLRIYGGRKAPISKDQRPAKAFNPIGCPYAARCRISDNICKERIPKLIEPEPGHLIACHMAKGAG
ncbi:MAG: ABC transporter ATP-binding protein [Actinomycetota bacterium]|nr:ABC transporter ATP-binding protein [Actinomycetota bacterium]